MRDSEMTIVIRAKNEATKALREVQSEISKISGGIKSYLGSAASASRQFAAGLAVVGVALGGLIGYGVGIAGDLEAAEKGFQTLLGSSQEASATVERIKKEAARTPFEIVGLTNATQLLSSVTKDGDVAVDILMDVGESLAAMGKGQAELDRIIINLQQIGAVGHASMIDIKQFAFAGIPIFDMLAETTGKTGEALSDMISNGEITFDLLVGMFDEATSKGGQFFDAFNNQAGTWNQLVSNMKDTFAIFASDVLKDTGIFQAMKDGLAQVINFINDNKDEFVEGIKNSLGWIKDNGPVLAGIIAGGLTSAFISLAGAIGANMVLLGPFMLVGAGLGILLQVLAQRFGGWAPMIEAARVKLNELWAIIEPVLMPVLDALKGDLNVVKGEFVKLKDEVVKFWKENRDWLIPTLKFVGYLLAVLIVGSIRVAIHSIALIIREVKKFATDVREKVSMVRNAFATVDRAIDNTKQKFYDLGASAREALSKLEPSNLGYSLGQSLRQRLGLPGFAGGVENFRGGMAIVGERGPELVRLPRGADVYSNGRSQQMLGGVTNHIAIAVTVQNDGTDWTEAQSVSMAKSIANQLRAQGLSLNQMTALR